MPILTGSFAASSRTNAALSSTYAIIARAARAVREQLGQRKRYVHVVRVARLAERLAVAHGVDPQRYLTSVLAKIGQTPSHELAQFLPDVWKRDDADASSAATELT